MQTKPSNILGSDQFWAESALTDTLREINRCVESTLWIMNALEYEEES